MKNNQYTALTIGPIYKTINRVKRTRAVSASSYFFSYFIKKIVEKSKDKLKIILPDDSTIYTTDLGAGLYADRVYFEGDVKTNVKEIVDEIIDEIASDIVKHVPEFKSNKPGVIKYLKDYLNILIIVLNENDKNKVLESLNDNLDLNELKLHFPFADENSPLLDYLDRRLRKNSALVQDAFGKSKKGRFLSIPEIATTDLDRKKPEEYKKVIEEVENNLKKDDPQHNQEYSGKEFDEDLEFIDLIKNNEELSKLLRPFHKYYAVLYADGDNIGKLLKTVSGDSEKLKGFSKLLFEFGKKAAQIINDYGGKAVYIGGEDIFAFLPLACQKPGDDEMQNIFHLIQQLDKAFQETIGNYAEENHAPVIPTLSYGILMGYIKHPLREAMKKAHALLDENAKKVSGKNAIAVRFEKHSGQYTTAIIEKGKSSSYEEIQKVISDYTKTLSGKNEDLLNSIIHRIRDDLFFKLFVTSAQSGKLNFFISNSFNEDLHKTGQKADFLKKVVELGNKLANDYPDNKNVKDILFTVLRYIQFLNAKN